MVEEKKAREAYLNAHELDDEANQHIVLKERKELGKPHISKKMRALLKSSGKQVCIKELTKNTESVAEPEVSVTWWRDGQKTYRDEQYYINPEMPMTRDNEDFLNVQQDDVSRMAASVNNALFELVPDEAQSITNKQRITRWDNKRKRYVRAPTRRRHGAVSVTPLLFSSRGAPQENRPECPLTVSGISDMIER